MAELKRNSVEVSNFAKNKIKFKAMCQISVIDEKPYYTNLAIQKITFKHKNIEYHLNHLWLQQRDYPAQVLDTVEKYAWYEIEFTFYPYRDKIDVNKRGIPMHGMTITSMKKLNKQ